MKKGGGVKGVGRPHGLKSFRFLIFFIFQLHRKNCSMEQTFFYKCILFDLKSINFPIKSTNIYRLFIFCCRFFVVVVFFVYGNSYSFITIQCFQFSFDFYSSNAILMGWSSSFVWNGGCHFNWRLCIYWEHLCIELALKISKRKCIKIPITTHFAMSNPKIFKNGIQRTNNKVVINNVPLPNDLVWNYHLRD